MVVDFETDPAPDCWDLAPRRVSFERRFSRTLNLPNSHPILAADRPVFPGFFSV